MVAPDIPEDAMPLAFPVVDWLFLITVLVVDDAVVDESVVTEFTVVGLLVVVGGGVVVHGPEVHEGLTGTVQ